MFVILFKNGNVDPSRDSFDKYYMPLVEIKDSNALIDSQPLLDQPVKNKQEVHEKLLEMSKTNDTATKNLLDTI